MSWVTKYSYDGQISYETKLESEPKLEQTIVIAAESIFLKCKFWGIYMKTHYQPKKPDAFGSKGGG